MIACSMIAWQTWLGMLTRQILNGSEDAQSSGEQWRAVFAKDKEDSMAKDLEC